MTSTSKFSRAFSLRDRRGRPRSKVRRVVSVAKLQLTYFQILETFTDSHHISGLEAADPYNIFTLDDDAKRISRDEDRKIEEIQSHFSRLGSGQIPDSRVAYALRAPDVDGDMSKAMDLIMLLNDTISGVIKPFNLRSKMLGAVNREKTTCYLDATLFAMFAKTNVFEAMIYSNFQDEPRRKLVIVIRLWVNMLRTGRLITTDITRKLQEALADCGWPDAGRLRQQDASEAFAFITDKLELPLLTLKTDLFHQGKYDKDDHKYITERLLDVAIPENVPQGAAIPLEKCLEEYFNNKVEVRREAHRRNTLIQKSDGEAAKSSGDKSAVTHIETTEVDSRAETPRPTGAAAWPAPPHLLSANDRTTSIFSERKVEAIQGVEVDQSRGQDDNRPVPPATIRKASVRKEVAMPAWQFLNLIPWYTDNESEADTQVKAHFASRRPMLGICLKRYKISNNGNAIRLNTQIDIPLEMAPPHFAMDDHNSADESANPNLKLVLQAVVCHRGQHVNSGHYIALVRTARSDPNGSFSNLTSGSDPDSRQDLWLRHDDLSVNSRVTSVSIQEALKAESPYLLFYQVLPVDEDNFSDDPPPYQESAGSFSTIGEKLAGLGRPSIEFNEYSSRRASVAISEESRSQWNSQALHTKNSSELRPLSFLRRDSGNVTESANTPQRTRPTTPHDELKQYNKQLTAEPKRTRTKSSRPSNEMGKRMGELVSRLGGGSGSREKVNMHEVTVAQVDDASSDDNNFNVTHVENAGELTKDNTLVDKQADKLQRQGFLSASPNDKGKSKDKDKKTKTKSRSRRSSVPLGKLPERECIVM
ncbi:MAG: hypothetical protein Q9159_001981 [Coniocarpon cinnabarinum]